MRADGAREAAEKAIRDADRAEAEAWSIRMEGYGGPAQPSPTIAQCLNGGLSWLEVEMQSMQDARVSPSMRSDDRATRSPRMRSKPCFMAPKRL